jgi:peptide/nickel transport system substrate-binding protein
VKRFALAVAALIATTGFAPVETPYFEKQVKDGALPGVAKRLPENPSVAAFDGPGETIGKPGGQLRMLMSQPRDTRMMVVYGYARLVVYDHDYKIVPDLLESFEAKDDRSFTFHLRKGHKWSDGKPFTTEDFRYFWEDVAQNKELSPAGVPHELMVDAKPPRVTVIDATTIRYEWEKPNPTFLPALAAPAPLYLFRPAHYLKRFHGKYANKVELQRMVAAERRRNWAQLHNRVDSQYRNDNPEMPTLEPWVLKTTPPSQRFVFERNPYYHRVDPAGHQLPYLDQVVFNLADTKIVALKTGSGESDLQARGLRFDNYTFLKKGEQRGGYKVKLWRTATGDHIVLFPNLNHGDPAWRALFRDVRFRRAISHAINRREINQVVFFGLGIEGNNTVLPESPLYKKEYRDAYTKFDLKEANRLLDEIGLTKRDGRGIRLLPDGRPLDIVVETAGESSEQTDVLELVHDSWIKAGIKLYSRPSQREVFRDRIFAGETQMAVWSGYENGLPNADTSPDEFAPTSQMQLQWPKWGQFWETKGRSGEAPDMEGPKELEGLYLQWRNASAREGREAIWHRILEIHAEGMYTIGLVGGIPQPIVVNAKLRNVPDKGVYNWDPGAHFGIYRPDRFWWDHPEARAAIAPATR